MLAAQTLPSRPDLPSSRQAEQIHRGISRVGTLAARLGMRLAEARAHAVDAGTSLMAFVVDNSSTPPETNIEADFCAWAD